MPFSCARKMLICSLIFCFTGQSFADGPWKLRKDKHNIQVYTKDVEGSSYNAVKTTTFVEGVSLSAAVALITDVESCTEWAPNCAKSYVYKEISETESLVYTDNDMPFPVSDRDVLSRVAWHQDPQTYEVTMTSQATVDILAPVKGKLRLTEANAGWTFTPLGHGKIMVTNQAHINPGSSLPGWVTNMLLVSTPYETMKAFTKQVKKPKYQNVSISFIHEKPEKVAETIESAEAPLAEKAKAQQQEPRDASNKKTEIQL
ncbi:MAG: hypothetical protein COW84_06620 [Gammaproteobacteria bacterium CG22_combo_CG10-13_8_21_14_all_40_8]|nr:MAG: hypothetical protein COW84_06620 [Gammaproteobacteria bacterium CG22_combo_CG10-13_8_21_14_all_40_8]